MISTVVKPDRPLLLLPLPEHYVGKDVAVLVYALDEALDENVPQEKASAMPQFNGMSEMSLDRLAAFHRFTEDGREE